MAEIVFNTKPRETTIGIKWTILGQTAKRNEWTKERNDNQGRWVNQPSLGNHEGKVNQLVLDNHAYQVNHIMEDNHCPLVNHWMQENQDVGSEPSADRQP